MAKCIINGCDLYDTFRGEWVHGDLWEEGNYYLFNACLVQGEAAWQHTDITQSDKVLTVMQGDYFERRGVFILSKSWSVLNNTAREYLYAH